MPIWKFVSCTAAAIAVVLTADQVSAQEYPVRPVRLTTADIGGGTDFVSRLIAQSFTQSLGKQVIVDNRGSVMSAEIVVRAPPDGYTILVGTDILWIGPLLRKLSYDPIKDLSPVSLMGAAPLILVVHPSLAVKSVRQLIDMARSKPGTLNSGSGSQGTPVHLAAVLFKSMAGVQIVNINYTGTARVLNAVLGGEVQFMFSTVGPATPHVKSGRLTALAVTSPQPSLLAPGLPTMAASGLGGYEMEVKYAMFVPARTPAAIIHRLNREVVAVLNQPSMKERLLSSGSLETTGSSPEQLTATIRSDMARLGKVIKDEGIREE